MRIDVVVDHLVVPAADVFARLELEVLCAPSRRVARMLSAAVVEIHLKPLVRLLGLDGAVVDRSGTVALPLGALHVGQRRTVPMVFRVPGYVGPGLLRLATVDVRYVEAPAGTRHRVFVPMAVDVVGSADG